MCPRPPATLRHPLLGVLTAAVVIAGTLLLSAPAPAQAQATPDWVPLADAVIHPGVQAVTDGQQCTTNFVFTDDAGGVYIGQAAHCQGTGDSSETDGCDTGTLPVGTEVTFDDATQPGVIVYSSWVTMQEVGEEDPSACAYNDFALIRIHPDDVPLVNPSLPHWGGPTGIADTTASGDPVYTFGNSGLRPAAERSGTSRGASGGGWTHTVSTGVLNPGIPGDSGSGFVDGQGRAFGVLSTLNIFPDVGSNGVSDLQHMLDYMQAHTGLDVTMATGTLTFSTEGDGTDTATGQAPSPVDADPVLRLTGPDGSSRVETAVAISQDAFPADGSAGAVVLARADVAADALAGAPLAAGLDAPLLLTQPDGLHPAAATELSRVLDGGGTVHLLGGTAALSAQVAADVEQRGFVVQRHQGASRIETAVAVADAVTDQPAQVLLADGQTFAAALVAGPAAHAGAGVVLLTDGQRPHPAVQAYLDAHPDAEVVAVGATAVAAHGAQADRALTAADDAALSAVVAADALSQAPVVGVARVDVFADALAGGAHVARLGGPILLSPSEGLTASVTDHLQARADVIGQGYLYGGTAALSPQVLHEVREAIS